VVVSVTERRSEMKKGLEGGNDMANGLTEKQKRLQRELDEIFVELGLDYWQIETYAKERRTGILDMQKRKVITGQVILVHSFLDELVDAEICEYFFGSGKTSVEAMIEKIRWRSSKKFRDFNEYILGNISLIKKLELVETLYGVPKSIVEDVRKLNTLRNVIAHEYYPVKLKRYKPRRKPLYKGKDIFTVEGIKLFAEDMMRVEDFFIDRLKRS
jgi:hypothetical protein